MSDFNHNNPLESASTLPLVPYFSTAAHYEKSAAEVYARKHFVCSQISLVAVASVLQENYKRRIGEADEVSKSLRELYFDKDATFQLGTEELAVYQKFRTEDSKQDATVAERAYLFFDKIHPTPLSAYEIYAGSREGDDDFADASFASACLAALAHGRSIVREDRPILPKLTRKIPDSHLHVVTTKIDVGGFTDMGGINGPESIGMMSRHAGLLDASQLPDSGRRVIETLGSHNRSLGRTEELLAARRELQRILEDYPDATTPVAESIYLTRRPLDL